VIITTRQVLAQVNICNGCCCGRTEKGRPPIPLDFLKREWKSRKLLKRVHLSVTGCLGPCEIANVVCVMGPDGANWLGNLTEEHEFEALLGWAERCAEANQSLPLPQELDEKRFRRWQS
jgi:predicted metal-binding protein